MEWSSALSSDVAVEAIGDLKRQGIRLLGIDVIGAGKDDTYKCRHEDCLDFSRKEYWDYGTEELCDLASDHIWSRNELLFEFVE